MPGVCLAFVKNSANFPKVHLLATKNRTPLHVLSIEFSEISQNSFLIGQLRIAAPIVLNLLNSYANL